jgi:radical SAM protein with 4Fe4S-binding SPASM domain
MTPLEKAQSSKTFCILPWIHQYVGPPGDVKPCCVYDDTLDLGNLKKNTLKEIWNSETSKKIRVDMLNGVEVPGCTTCNIRNYSSQSPRGDANNTWVEEINTIVNETHTDGYLPEHKLKYVDARFNNLCNFKCRTCTPHFSTSWHEDYEKLRNPDEVIEYPKPLLIPGNTPSQLLDEILPHLSEVKRIYFAGGEPLMQIEHYKVLEELIRINHTGTSHKPLSIQYSTNFSSLSLGKHSIFDYWKKFNRIMVHASLDGTYKRAEYWRKGTDWKTIVSNREELKKNCPHVTFNIGSTLSWVNAFNLLELHKEWTELKYININSMLINVLDSPNFYSIKHIPNWKKKKIEIAFTEHIDWLIEKKAKEHTKQQYLNAISAMYSIETGDEFLQATAFNKTSTELDNLRGENFWDIFPEHNDMKELINGSNSL